MGLGDTHNLRRDLANQAWSVEILLTVSDESDKINTQDWSWNITVDTVGLLSLMHQVFIFILKCIVYAAFCGLIWLLQGSRWRKLVDDTAWTTQNLKGLFCSEGWNVLLVIEWMKTKCLCHGSSFCDYRGCKHQPVNCRSIVFSSHSKKSFIQLHCLKALFKLLLILLFYSKP